MMPISPLTHENVAYRDFRQPVNQPEMSLGAFPHSKELSRLLTAAVVSRRFCGLLLADPLQAVTTGYNGETFRLSPEEVQQILAIKAPSLREFALQLLTKSHAPEKALGEGQPIIWLNKHYITA
jgi:hypothetical protein